MKRNIIIVTLATLLLGLCACSKSIKPIVVATITPTLVSERAEDATVPYYSSTIEKATDVAEISNAVEDKLTFSPSGFCEFSKHIFGEPVITPSSSCVLDYEKEEVCTICGFEYRTVWCIYIPEGATSLPEPGGELDAMLYIEYCSDGSHIIGPS